MNSMIYINKSDACEILVKRNEFYLFRSQFLMDWEEGRFLRVLHSYYLWSTEDYITEQGCSIIRRETICLSKQREKDDE